jgi:hypothetical protein
VFGSNSGEQVQVTRLRSAVRNFMHRCSTPAGAFLRCRYPRHHKFSENEEQGLKLQCRAVVTKTNEIERTI